MAMKEYVALDELVEITIALNCLNNICAVLAERLPAPPDSQPGPIDVDLAFRGLKESIANLVLRLERRVQ